MPNFFSLGDISVAAIVLLVAKAYVDWKTKSSIEELKTELARKTKAQQEIGADMARKLLVARSTVSRELSRLKQALKDLSETEIQDLSRQKYRADARRALASMKEPLEHVLAALPEDEKLTWREFKMIITRYEAEDEVELSLLFEIQRKGEELLDTSFGAIV